MSMAQSHVPTKQQPSTHQLPPSQQDSPFPGSEARGFAASNLFNLRLNVDRSASVRNDGAHGLDMSATTPSPVSGESPLSVKTKKWNAILQRLHNTTAQLLNRKSVYSPTGQEVPLSPEQEASPPQGPNTRFDNFTTLRQRLREVKQSTQQRITQDSDDSSTVVTETPSVVEGKLAQLLSQPLVPAAAAGAGTAGAAGNGRGLNLVVRRFKSPSRIPGLLEPAQPIPAAAPPPCVTTAAHSSADCRLTGLSTAAGALQQPASTAANAGASLAVRKSSYTSLRVSVDHGTNLAAAGDAGIVAPAAAGGGVTTLATGEGTKCVTKAASYMNLKMNETDSSTATGTATSSSPEKHEMACNSNNSTGSSNSISGGHVHIRNLSSSSLHRRNAHEGITVAVPSAGTETTVTAAAGDRGQSRHASGAGWRPDCHAAADGAASTACIAASCNAVLNNDTVLGAAKDSQAAAHLAAGPSAAPAPAPVNRETAAMAHALESTPGLHLQLPPSKFLQHSGGDAASAATAASDQQHQQRHTTSTAGYLAPRVGNTSQVQSAASAAVGAAGAAAAGVSGARRGLIPLEPQLNRRASSSAPHVFATFHLPSHMYNSQEDILNDSDIQELLRKVEAACNGWGPAEQGAAGVAPKVHWHVHNNSTAQGHLLASAAAASAAAADARKDGAPAASSASGSRSEIHVHIDADADGQLSVVISDMDQEPSGPGAAVAKQQEAVALLHDGSKLHGEADKQQHIGNAQGTSSARPVALQGTADAGHVHGNSATATTANHSNLLGPRVDACDKSSVARAARMSISLSGGTCPTAASAASTLFCSTMRPTIGSTIGPSLELINTAAAVMHAKEPHEGAPCATAPQGSDSCSRVRQQSHTGAAVAAEAKATEPSAVVGLSSAALAAAAREQQSSTRRSSAAAADAAETASSLCDGASDLTALANPVVFADTLCKRMDMHLGPVAEAGLGTAHTTAANDAQGPPVTPRTTARQLDEFIQDHKPLQRKAARLSLNLQHRLQQRQQQQLQSTNAAAGVGAGVHDHIKAGREVPSWLGPAAAQRVSNSTHLQSSAGAAAAGATGVGASRDCRPPAAAAGLAGHASLLSTAAASTAAVSSQQTKLQYQQHAGQAAGGACSWLLGNRRLQQRRDLAATASVAEADGDDDRTLLNVDELKHDLEACLRRVG